MTSAARHPFMTRLGNVLKSLLTGPDGESYAPGRFMGFIAFALGEAITVYVVLKIAAGHPSVSDWALALQSLALWQGAVCTLSIGLVLGMAPTDSGGKWWGKDASPPPPPTTDPAPKLG